MIIMIVTSSYLKFNQHLFTTDFILLKGNYINQMLVRKTVDNLSVIIKKDKT